MNILASHELRVIDRFTNVMETKLDFAQTSIRLKKQVEMWILSLSFIIFYWMSDAMYSSLFLTKKEFVAKKESKSSGRI